jgi:hypothetical protein
MQSSTEQAAVAWFGFVQFPYRPECVPRHKSFSELGELPGRKKFESPFICRKPRFFIENITKPKSNGSPRQALLETQFFPSCNCSQMESEILTWAPYVPMAFLGFHSPGSRAREFPFLSIRKLQSNVRAGEAMRRHSPNHFVTMETANLSKRDPETVWTECL